MVQERTEGSYGVLCGDLLRGVLAGACVGGGLCPFEGYLVEDLLTGVLRLLLLLWGSCCIVR